MLDDVAGYNRDRWQALVEAGVSFSRPWLELDAETARARLDQEGHLGEVAGQDVLCLAGGGGQQSAAFALLGARVSVLDLCEGQLDRDREALAHHGLQARLVAGDMRDLSAFEDDAFDLVWHAHALSFVPDPRPVFDEVARVLRPEGRYRLYCTIPSRTVCGARTGPGRATLWACPTWTARSSRRRWGCGTSSVQTARRFAWTARGNGATRWARS